jgi:hypothetical protein
MDELGRELALFEVIAASDAMNNAATALEETLTEGEEWQQAILEFVLPVLDAAHERLDEEYQRIRSTL